MEVSVQVIPLAEKVIIGLGFTVRLADVLNTEPPQLLTLQR